MRAVVLVGGEGTRLRPLTFHTPKQMLRVIGFPMLERVLRRLSGFGVDEVVLSLGYQPDAFRLAYPDGEAAGVRLTYAIEEEPLDTAGAIRFAAESAGINETFLVVNGDILTDLAGSVFGGIGFAASANLNLSRSGPSLFEPVHGAAHDIAGTGKANPVAAIRSAAMMLDYLGEQDASSRMDEAVFGYLREHDPGQSVHMTADITDEILSRLR